MKNNLKCIHHHNSHRESHHQVYFVVNLWGVIQGNNNVFLNNTDLNIRVSDGFLVQWLKVSLAIPATHGEVLVFESGFHFDFSSQLIHTLRGSSLGWLKSLNLQHHHGRSNFSFWFLALVWLTAFATFWEWTRK